jgi:nicotinamidase-related amidase
MNTKFSTDDTAMLLIDHQVGTIHLVGNMDKEIVIQNTRALARTAVEAGIPLVLSTSNETQFQGPLLDDLLKIAPEAHAARIKRPGTVNAWDYEPFRNAVEATGKKKLIMAGLTNDVCVVFPAISAVKAGYEVQVVVDAGGSPTQLSDETALRRMENAGVVLTGTNQLMAELAYDWSTPIGGKLLTVMYEEILHKFMQPA